MTLVKCPNGHFYDPARFGNKCPHCGMIGQENTGDETTIPLSGMEAKSLETEADQSGIVTKKVTQTVSDDDKTIPVPSDMLDGVFGRTGRRAMLRRVRRGIHHMGLRLDHRRMCLADGDVIIG